MHKNIFVIGNGFDLDLGLSTKFSDFAKSSFWPKQGGKAIPNLGLYLETKAFLNKNSVRLCPLKQQIEHVRLIYNRMLTK